MQNMEFYNKNCEQDVIRLAFKYCIPSSLIDKDNTKDLESLFWIALYIIIAWVDYEPSQEYAKKIYVHELWATHEQIQVF